MARVRACRGSCAALELAVAATEERAVRAVTALNRAHRCVVLTRDETATGRALNVAVRVTLARHTRARAHRDAGVGTPTNGDSAVGARVERAARLSPARGRAVGLACP